MARRDPLKNRFARFAEQVAGSRADTAPASPGRAANPFSSHARSLGSRSSQPASTELVIDEGRRDVLLEALGGGQDSSARPDVAPAAVGPTTTAARPLTSEVLNPTPRIDEQQVGRLRAAFRAPRATTRESTDAPPFPVDQDMRNPDPALEGKIPPFPGSGTVSAVGRGAIESVQALMEGLSGLDLLVRDALPFISDESVDAERERRAAINDDMHRKIRETFGDPNTVPEIVAFGGSRLAGDLVQFMVPEAVVARAFNLPRAIGIGQRIGREILFGAPVDFTLAVGSRENSLAGFFGDAGQDPDSKFGELVRSTGAEDLLDGIADDPFLRGAFDAILGSVMASGVVVGIEQVSKAARNARSLAPFRSNPTAARAELSRIIEESMVEGAPQRRQGLPSVLDDNMVEGSPSRRATTRPAVEDLPIGNADELVDQVSARRVGMPQDLREGLNLLGAERANEIAVTTEGSQVLLKDGTPGKVIRPTDRLLSDKRVLVEHEFTDKLGNTSTVQRFHRPLDLEPAPSAVKTGIDPEVAEVPVDPGTRPTVPTGDDVEAIDQITARRGGVPEDVRTEINRAFRTLQVEGRAQREAVKTVGATVTTPAGEGRIVGAAVKLDGTRGERRVLVEIDGKLRDFDHTQVEPPRAEPETAALPVGRRGASASDASQGPRGSRGTTRTDFLEAVGGGTGLRNTSRAVQDDSGRLFLGPNHGDALARAEDAGAEFSDLDSQIGWVFNVKGERVFVAEKSVDELAGGKLTPEGFADTIEQTTGFSGTQSTPNPEPTRMVSARGTRGELRSDKVFSLDSEEIDLEPERFQFKQEGKAARGELLRDVSSFDPDKAGVIAVWFDPADQRFKVVNGHNRLNLRKQTGGGPINVIELDAGSAEQARAAGALINMAEGRGTAFDVAKFLRDTGIDEADLRRMGVPLTENTVRQGVATSKLDNVLFGAFRRKEIPLQRAVMIGDSGLSPDEQLGLFRLIDKKEAAGRRLRDDEVAELIRFSQGAGQREIQQETLFGTEAFTVANIAEKAEVSAFVRGALRKDRSLFSFLSKAERGRRIEESGVGDVNVLKAGELGAEAAQFEEAYDRLATRSGGVSDILNRAATDLAEGGNPNAIKQQALTDVRGVLEGTIAPGGAGRGAGGGPAGAGGRAQPGLGLDTPTGSPVSRTAGDNATTGGRRTDVEVRKRELAAKQDLTPADFEELSTLRATPETPRPTPGEPLIRVDPNELDRGLAQRAHEGSSFTPEVRAKQEQQSFVDTIERFEKQVREIATTDEAKAVARTQLEGFKDGILKRMNAKLAADSRTVSSMITGPSGFPTARNAKRLATAQKRLDELLEFETRAKRRIMKKVRAALPQADPDAQIAKLERLQETMKTANRIVRQKGLTDEQKIAKIVSDLGFSEATARQMLGPDAFGNIGFPAFELTSNRNKIKRLRARSAELERRGAREGVETDFAGGQVVENVDEDRLQIFFDEKPDAATRARLKAEGFRFAPSQGNAWQRQLTENARQAARRVLGDVSGQAGGVPVGVPSALAGTGLGAAIGAVTDEEDPLMGAAIGAAIGAGLGIATARLAANLIFPTRKHKVDAKILRLDRDPVTGRGPTRIPPFEGELEIDEFANIGKIVEGAPNRSAAAIKRNPGLADVVMTDLEKQVRGDVERVLRNWPDNVPKQVVPWKQTIALAESMGFKVEDLKPDNLRRLNGPEMLAMRNRVVTNGDAIVQARRRLAERVDYTRDETAAIEATIAALEDQNSIILDRFIQARSQTGRDLNNLKIIASRTDDPVYWFTKAKQELGAQPFLDEHRANITKLLDAGDREGLLEFITSLRVANVAEKVSTVWKAALLTAPPTHFANILGNTSMFVLENAKDAPALVFDRILKHALPVRRTTTDGVRARFEFGTKLETKAPTVRGFARGTRRGAAKGFGEAQRALGVTAFRNVVEQEGASMAGARRAIREGLDQLRNPSVFEANLRKMDKIQHVSFNNAFMDIWTQGVFKGLVAFDRFFRGMAMFRSLEEQARLLARFQLGEGAEPAKLAEAIDKLLEVPSDEMVMNAVRDSEVAIFINRNALGDAAIKLKKTFREAGAVPGLASEFVLPFSLTPANVATRAVEFTPLGFAKTVPDLVRLWREVARGGELAPEIQRRVADVLGRATIGTAPVAMGFLMFQHGLMTGSWPADSKEQTDWLREGKTENAVLVGGKWRSVDRISPFGNAMAFGAHMAEVSKDPEMTKLGKITSATVSVARTVKDQTFLRGVAGALAAIDGRRGEAESFVEQTGRSLVPRLIGRVAQATDPFVHDVEGFGEAVRSQIPGMSSSLPTKINAFGEEIVRTPAGFGQVFDPFNSRPDATRTDPLIGELARVNAGVPRMNKRPDESREDFRARRIVYGKALRTGLEGIIASDIYKQVSELVARQLPPDADVEAESAAIQRELLEEARKRIRTQLSKRLRRLQPSQDFDDFADQVEAGSDGIVRDVVVRARAEAMEAISERRLELLRELRERKRRDEAGR